MKETTVNRQSKDRLFRKIFDGGENKENLLSLYNAINETEYSDINNLEITTIDDVIFLGMKNDVSFIIDYTMNLYEHQSTFCPNMPLRGLLYASKLYEQFVGRYRMKLYSNTVLYIPEPRYIVFFNGSELIGDSIKLKLSDMFLSPSAMPREAEKNQGNIEPEFQWTATLLNINLGHNKQLMERCRPLTEYSTYVDKLNGYRRKLPLEKAAEKTVDECIKEGILVNFLTKHRSEVLNLILTEYDEEEVRQVFYEDGVRDGIKDGIRQGMREKALESAMKLKKAGVSDEIIADAVDLPLDVIQKLTP